MPLAGLTLKKRLIYLPPVAETWVELSETMSAIILECTLSKATSEEVPI